MKRLAIVALCFYFAVAYYPYAKRGWHELRLDEEASDQRSRQLSAPGWLAGPGSREAGPASSSCAMPERPLDGQNVTCVYSVNAGRWYRVSE